MSLSEHIELAEISDSEFSVHSNIPGATTDGWECHAQKLSLCLCSGHAFSVLLCTLTWPSSIPMQLFPVKYQSLLVNKFSLRTVQSPGGVFLRSVLQSEMFPTSPILPHARLVLALSLNVTFSHPPPFLLTDIEPMIPWIPDYLLFSASQRTQTNIPGFLFNLWNGKYF